MSAIQLDAAAAEKFKASLASFTVHEMKESSGIVRRTAEQNKSAVHAFLESAVWFQPLGVKVDGLIAALSLLLAGESVNVHGVSLVGIGSLRCIGCQGIHGAPSQGFAPTVSTTWPSTANRSTLSKARLFLVTYADGSKRIAYISDTCFSEHFLTAPAFKAFKIASKQGKTLAAILAEHSKPTERSKPSKN